MHHAACAFPFIREHAFSCNERSSQGKMSQLRVSPALYGFETIGEELLYLPLAARRVLDILGMKLALDGWRSLSLESRRRIVSAGLAERVDAESRELFDRAVPKAEPMGSVPDPDPHAPSADLGRALGSARPLSEEVWRSLRAIDRYALVKSAANPEKLARAYEEIVGGGGLPHLTADGQARMVDVGAKDRGARRAIASARVRTTGAVVDAVAARGVAKGDVFAVARVAGLLAAKRTADLIPLCHPVQTTHAVIEFGADVARGEISILATVEAVDRTGVEMEAMTAASIAALTVYDMIKGVDRWAFIETVQLEEKSGGKSGLVTRPPAQVPHD